MAEKAFVYSVDTKKWFVEGKNGRPSDLTEKFEEASEFPSAEAAQLAVEESFFPPTEGPFEFTILKAVRDISVRVKIEKEVQVGIGRMYD